MNFETQIPEWKNEGTEPSDSLKTNGFKEGYKPPAGVFNWFWHLVLKALDELQKHTHTKFEHSVSMSGNKITDVAAPELRNDVATRGFVEDFSIEGSTYVAVDEKEDGNIVLRPYIADEDELTFKSHIDNTTNPHGVTASQIGAATTAYADKAAENAVKAFQNERFTTAISNEFVTSFTFNLPTHGSYIVSIHEMNGNGGICVDFGAIAILSGGGADANIQKGTNSVLTSVTMNGTEATIAFSQNRSLRIWIHKMY